MYVKTEYGECPYITAGKVYEVYYISPVGFHWIMSDCGEKFPLKPYEPCPVFDGRGQWTICDKDGKPVSMQIYNELQKSSDVNISKIIKREELKMTIRQWITHSFAFGILFFALVVLPGMMGD